MIGSYTYTITFNRSKKTYTIRVYYKHSRCIAKYRSLPQGSSYHEDWCEHDIVVFLRGGDYVRVF